MIKEKKIMGQDVNKFNKPNIPEMGGLSIPFGITISLLVAANIQKYFVGDFNTIKLYAVLGVFYIAFFIGIIDDLCGINGAKKALYLMIPAFPIILLQQGLPIISLPFNYFLDVPSLIYWLFLVPIGITCAANAMNMCAGYNGLESGSTVIVSFFLLLISYFQNPHGTTVLIFTSLLGISIALYHYNKFPARIFLGNVGVLAIGATIAASSIIGNIELYAIICILPTFYELYATIYYAGINNIERRVLCNNPIIFEDGKLKPPVGAKYYTLSFFILGKKPMREKNLVWVHLCLFFIFGIFSIIVSTL